MEYKELSEGISGYLKVQNLVSKNEKTQRFGLSLSEEDAKMLLEKQKEMLKEQGRIELGEGILPKLIFTFCDSPYIYQDNYRESISQLQEVFYLYKRESMEELSDDELLEVMKNAFDGECEGSIKYLEETILDAFARKIRSDKNLFFGKGSQINKGGCDWDEL